MATRVSPSNVKDALMSVVDELSVDRMVEVRVRAVSESAAGATALWLWGCTTTGGFMGRFLA